MEKEEEQIDGILNDIADGKTNLRHLKEKLVKLAESVRRSTLEQALKAIQNAPKGVRPEVVILGELVTTDKQLEEEA